MAEFGDAGNKEETDVVIVSLQNAVKALQNLLNSLDVRIGNIVQNRFVIFINQDDRLFAGGCEKFKQGGKTES